MGDEQTTAETDYKQLHGQRTLYGQASGTITQCPRPPGPQKRNHCHFSLRPWL